MDDIATVTPDLEAACRKLISDNHIQVGMGPYAPPTYNPHPRCFPERNWRRELGGGSFNLATGYLFINVNDLGQINGVKDPAGGPVNLATLAGSNMPGGRTGPYSNIAPGGRFRDNPSMMPCNQPPWGELVAVNVNTGDIAWRVPLGITESLPPEKQKTGRPRHGRLHRHGFGPSSSSARQTTNVSALRRQNRQRIVVHGQPQCGSESPCRPLTRAGTASSTLW